MTTKFHKTQNMIVTIEDKTLQKNPPKDRRGSASKKVSIRDNNPNKENVTKENVTNKGNKNKKDEKKEEVAMVNSQRHVVDIEDEPLLKPNPRRFVLFPIQFHEVRIYYL